MSFRISINRTACDGFGNCVRAAEEIFALGDDGIAIAKQSNIGPEHIEAVRRAMYDCPTNAISIVEDKE